MAITVRQRRRRPTTTVTLPPLVRGLKMCGLGMAMFIISRESSRTGSSSSTTQQHWVVSAGSALWKSRFVATRSKRGHIRPVDANVLRLLSTTRPLRGGGSDNFIHTTTAASSPPTPIEPLARQSLSQQQLQHQQQYSADFDDDTFAEEGSPYAVYSSPPSDNADSEFLATGTSSSSSTRSTYSDATEHGDPFQETVQDRVDHWRHQLQENAAQLQQSPRDDKGRLKLLTSVGKGSRTLKQA